MFNQLYALTVASLKMYYRNVTAVFFSLFIPILIIVIFGLILGGNKSTTFNLGIADKANNEFSRGIITTLDKTKAFVIKKDTKDNLLAKLKTGDEDIVLEIPEGFNAPSFKTPKLPAIQGYYDKSKEQNAQIAFMIINNLFTSYNEGLNAQINKKAIITYLNLKQSGVNTNNLTQIDFLIPGVMAMSIMQLGIFSVAFAFTSMKKTGALKRLEVTPARPLNFIISQSVARLILTIFQVSLLLFLGTAFFGLHMYGNIFSFMAFVLLGSLVFLSIGFAIAGYSKDENQAAPITNLVSLPMMFLSGVFFPRNLMPDFLQRFTDYFPLTYLADALREIANNGASITSLGHDLLGLIVWAILGIIVAVKVFKWE